jgi:succinate dehydrogenase / fumarate reductase cytochrome b subunit
VTATQERKESKPKRGLPWLLEIYRTDVGKKYAMAISGIIGLSFILFHMIGNLHVFEGFDQASGEFRIDEYGEGLRDIGEPLAPRTFLLWLLRIPLTLALIVHVHAAWALSRSNQKARGSQRYEGRNYLAANYASRTMRWSGIIILLFIAWHLADLTWGIEAVNPDFERGEVYNNLIATLERWPVFVFYVVAQGALAFHVWHGSWSLFQSLGWNNTRFNKWRRWFATGLTVVIIAGFLAVPIGVQIGLIS